MAKCWWNSVVSVCSYPPYLPCPIINHHQEHYHDRYQQLWGNIQLGGTTLTYDRGPGAILGVLVLPRGEATSLIANNVDVWW